jgi:transcriptional regulator GlxA family with amidase domain
MQRKKVGIVLFNDVEVLDFAGPFEVFSAVRLDEDRRREEPSPFEVVLIAEGPGAVRASGGLHLLPDFDLDTCPPLDILLVPGGWGTRTLVDNPRLVNWIRERSAPAEVVASVCTGSFLLAKAGLLDGIEATTHWKSLDRMEMTFPTVKVNRDARVVDRGKIVTSAGIAAGLDLALRLVSRYHGEGVARATARQMEYPYPESNARRV